MEKMKKRESDYAGGFIYLFLIFGIVTVIGGIYLESTNTVAKGISTGGRWSPRAGTPVSISGKWVIALGLAILVLPTYALLKRFFKKW